MLRAAALIVVLLGSVVQAAPTSKKKAARLGPPLKEFAVVSTAPITREAILHQFRRFDAGMLSLEARFDQKLKLEDGGMGRGLSGTLRYLHPERLRIEHEKPERQTVVSDGKDIWVHRHAHSQVVQSKLEDWKASDPTAAQLLRFGSYAAMLDEYEVELSTTGARPTLRLTPKESDPDRPVALTLKLSKKTLFPEETILEAGNLQIVTRVLKPRFNGPVDPALYRFDPPAGTDVFRDFKPPRFQP